jgi:hypothetical protein
MNVTRIHDTSDIEAEYDAALNHVTKFRARGKVAAMSLLGAALLALLGMTYAMYARAPAAPSFRTGTSQ